MTDDTYPIAIIEDRYCGSYSGGAWLAIAGADRAFNDMGCRTPDEVLAKLRSKGT